MNTRKILTTLGLAASMAMAAPMASAQSGQADHRADFGYDLLAAGILLEGIGYDRSARSSM